MGSSWLAPFLIMLREGLEAALIIGIVATYLVQTGRRAWMPVMGVGIFLAVALALYVGAALQWLAAEFPQKQQELFEALVGFLAVAMLTSMVLWMSGSGQAMAARLRGAVAQATAGGGTGSAWALVGMVFLAVAREGLESVFFLLAVFQQGADWQAPAGALAGVAVAVVVGWLLYRGGIRLNLRRFFGATALLIVLVAAGLLAGSLRKLHEAGVWNIGQQPVADFSAVLPADSVLGSVLSGLLGYQAHPVVSEAVVYLAYLVICGALLAWRAPARGGGEEGCMTAPSTAPQPTAAGPSPRLWRGLLAASIALALSGLHAFYAASVRPQPAAAAVDERVVTVTIRGGTCDPSDITVPAGRTRFVVVNQSDRALEWEILDGVMVIDERENITPGMSQSLRVRLAPGDYQITCGLLSSPRGRLRVLPSAESHERAQAPQMADFIGALAEYRVYTLLQADDLLDALDQLQTALAGGDTAGARTQLDRAAALYASIAPVAQAFGDLDARLDVRADYLAQRERDPAFMGLRALQEALTARDTARASALARQARDDAQALQARLRTPSLTPAHLLQASASALRRLVSHAGEAASPFDAATASGLQDGVQKVLDVLQPVVGPVAAPTVADPWRHAGQALAAWQAAGAGQSPALLQTLADALGQVADALGTDAAPPAWAPASSSSTTSPTR